MSDGEQKTKAPRDTKPKGGSRFPRYALREAVAWAEKLVSKTHSGPQSADIIFASVVKSKGSTAEMKVSALKQFNLLQGDSKGYLATELAKALSVAPEVERSRHLREAALAPTIFKGLFDTFHGDEATVAQLKQRAAALNVHPENLSTCINIYSESLSYAGLVTASGDKVAHLSPEEDTLVSSDGDGEVTQQADLEQESNQDEEFSSSIKAPRAVFHVNVALDASLDTDKLERQLSLLKKYGAI